MAGATPRSRRRLARIACVVLGSLFHSVTPGRPCLSDVPATISSTAGSTTGPAAKAVFTGPSSILLGETAAIQVAIKDDKLQDVDAQGPGAFTVTSSTPHLIDVHRHVLHPHLLAVIARATGEANISVKRGNVEIGQHRLQVLTIADFKPLSVSLQAMDSTTAAELFGKRISKDFYVVRVQLLNNLDKTLDDRYIGQSLLVYGDSIEVSVGLEKKPDPRFRSANRKNVQDPDWSPVKPEDRPQVQPTPSGAQNSVAGGPDPRPPGAGPAPATNATVVTGPHPTGSDSSRRTQPTFRYRPYGFNLMLNSAAKMGNSHRQNLLSMTMKPLEEIPFGSDIARVIFFPRKPFHGFIEGHLTQISGIDTSSFNVTMALLIKTQSGTVQANAGNDTTVVPLPTP